MTSKTIVVALAMLLTATSASLAWTHKHHVRGHGIYNSVASPPHFKRGGPGPRVEDGNGMGTGAQR